MKKALMADAKTILSPAMIRYSTPPLVFYASGAEMFLEGGGRQNFFVLFGRNSAPLKMESATDENKSWTRLWVYINDKRVCQI